MSRLAVIATLYERPERVAAIADALRSQTRRPDEFWLMYEEQDPEQHTMAHAIYREEWLPGMRVRRNETPRGLDGRYRVTPYSLKINYALDHARADYIAYLTDDSLPAPTKYEAMTAALDEHPEWGVVYCSQDWTAPDGTCAVRSASGPVENAACVVDHTQVMHRASDARWPLDVALIRLGDAHFWRELHARFGAFQPVPAVLDVVRQDARGISATY